MHSWQALVDGYKSNHFDTLNVLAFDYFLFIGYIHPIFLVIVYK
ncbi:hypothetical protein SUB0149 [Streptococcus uberis 0140J]|uniref:Uncharacterized protein n=1 Tax=Streptococcus uberis (strain ATCC BAA-854 / 0140J) TaxID=218495 RepID=B9DT28_STRU0|nr:hypothetical protein SUB0149 [Streptococcus uberis 0140J]